MSDTLQSNGEGVLVPRTVGVEEEFLLVDPRSGAPVPASEGLLSVVDATWSKRIEREVKQEQIEVVSQPCTDLDAVSEAVYEGRRIADQAARRVGAQAVALGTSVLPGRSHLTDRPRYFAMSSKFGITMREQLTCGLHVHVGVEDDEEGVAVLDRLRPWLPVLHAMTANSPFWHGEDSGYASYRYQLWSRWPSSGPYDLFGSAEAYHERAQAMLATGAITDLGMIYFDARLSHHLPTIEVRVADICMEAEHTIAIVALVRGLVETTAREWRRGVEPVQVSAAVLRLAMWSASRYGLGGKIFDARSEAQVEAVTLVGRLHEYVEEALRESGDSERVRAAIESMLAEGTGADRQRKLFAATGEAHAVVADAIDVTHRGPKA